MRRCIESQGRKQTGFLGHWADLIPMLQISPNSVHDCATRGKRRCRASFPTWKRTSTEYESLNAGNFAFEQLKNVSALPSLLISARVANGLSQRNPAKRRGLKEQQIQRYEASHSASASFTRIRELVAALGIEVDDRDL